MVSVRIDVQGFDNFAAEANRKMKRCMAIALTKTAVKLQADIKQVVPEVFDRPKPFTVNGLYLRVAKADSLVAEVGFKDIQARYLSAEVAGGRRAPKRFEAALRARGALPGGYITVPGNDVKVDSFGNIPRSVIVEILREIGPTLQRGRRTAEQRQTLVDSSNKKKRKPTYNGVFVVMPADGSHLQPGIYRRYVARDRRPKCLLAFMTEANYKQRLKLVEIGEKAVRDNLSVEFSKVFNT